MKNLADQLLSLLGRKFNDKNIEALVSTIDESPKLIERESEVLRYEFPTNGFSLEVNLRNNLIWEIFMYYGTTDGWGCLYQGWNTFPVVPQNLFDAKQTNAEIHKIIGEPIQTSPRYKPSKRTQPIRSREDAIAYLTAKAADPPDAIDELFHFDKFKMQLSFLLPSGKLIEGRAYLL